ncbi:MAG: type II CRISPR-associated endonuclease Cas1 [Methylotenera sp.]|nr:type II CRISPR-associated endonuclease Cas1 [Methylotenera sp.]
MAWQNLLISRPARLSLKNRQLRCEQDSGEVSLALEDITSVVLESPQITLTSALIAACADENIAIISCDETHTPNGLFNSFLPHSRQAGMLRAQIAWSKPFTKRLWQLVVKQKITNQAATLKLCGREHARLTKLATEVDSGDSQNCEAQAARLYFNVLFDGVNHDAFKRHGEDLPNAALNYGYAILRAAIARELVQFGFIPALGIHHCSELNAFNLADDLIEPFRPFLDAYVSLNNIGQHIESAEEGLTLQERASLVQCLQLACMVAGEKHTLLYAIHLLVKSLSTATEQAKADKLLMPTMPREFGIKVMR